MGRRNSRHECLISGRERYRVLLGSFGCHATDFSLTAARSLHLPIAATCAGLFFHLAFVANSEIESVS